MIFIDKTGYAKTDRKKKRRYFSDKKEYANKITKNL